MNMTVNIKSRLAPILAALVIALPWQVSASGEIESVRRNLASIIPSNLEIGSIEPSPMSGVYIVSVGNQEMYVYSNGDFIMVGEVYDSIRAVSLGKERKAMRMSRVIEKIPESEMILMGESQQRHVTVFTDTDCFYCQKFNKTVPELESRGMQVRYLMFPRAGLESDSYREAVSVWCSEDQARAITIAKSGGVVDPLDCDNPVARQYELGQKLGVRGTPTMILDNGKMIPGFLTPDQLFAEAGALN
jgi:thiol:disulfide interchange protein DsbC